MIPFDDERYKAAGCEAYELEKASGSCRDAGTIVVTGPRNARATMAHTSTRNTRENERMV